MGGPAKKQRICVTGGAGFIGSAACRALARDGVDVLNIDKLTYAANLNSLAEIADRRNYRFEKGDIADRTFLDRVFADFKPDAIMHFAAETHVDRSITGSDVFIQTNVVGTHALLGAARAYWEGLSGDAKDGFRFLHVSTDEVFGSLGDTGFFNETTPYDPQSPYSASKAAADHLVRAWGSTYKLPVLLTNCTNNYGPYHFPEKLIPLATINALEGKPVAVYGAGANVRDWLHVDDHVAALRLILDRAAPGASYMIGGRAERTNLQVVYAICDALDAIAPRPGSRRDLIQFVADRPGHDWRYAADCAKIERELGWARAHAFEAGLRETVQWYVDRRDWWQPIREGRYQGGRLGLLAEQA